MSFKGLDAWLTPKMQAEDSRVYDSNWNEFDFPAQSTDTYPDIERWLPVGYAGMYYFPSEYINAYFSEVLGYDDSTEYDTWMDSYDGWALGAYFYSRQASYKFGTYQSFGACFGVYCAGVYTHVYNNGGGYQYDLFLLDYKCDSPDASTPTLYDDTFSGTMEGNGYWNTAWYYYNGFIYDVADHWMYLGRTIWWQMQPANNPDYSVGDSFTIVAFTSQ
jgi:hypothetical protein